MTIFMDFRHISPPCLLFFLLSFCFLISTITAGNNDTENLVPPNTVNGGGGGGGGGGDGDNIGDISTTNPSLLPPPPPPPPPDSLPNGRTNNFAPFRPSIAVIVGVLTTMFSITFLLLLYAKHCKRGHAVGGLVYGGGGNVNSRNGLQSSAAARKNSGIDRNVIESLPIFRFGSLRGQKDGLECAVCLTRFETTEVLRLLPKCKHAFHVECVDTWLDAHSTCPLCRYRVDAEDILLVEDAMILRENEPLPPPQPPSPPPPPPQQDQEADVSDIESRRSGTELNPGYRRVSGRHSSAGERGSNGFLQIILQRPGEPAENSRENPTLLAATTTTTTTTSSRRSLDSSSLKRKTSNNESVNLGCFEHRTRKDGLLLLSSDQNRKSFEQRRFSHRIIVSADHHHHQQQQQRWSDVQPSDLLYLRSEMILSDDSRRYSSSASGSRPSSSSRTRQQRHHQKVQVQVQEGEESSGSAEVGIDDGGGGGRNVINTRCVSEITGLSRFPSNHNYNYNYNYNNRHLQQLQLQERQRQQRQEEGVVSRWLAWISQSRPAVRSQGGQVGQV